MWPLVLLLAMCLCSRGGVVCCTGVICEQCFFQTHFPEKQELKQPICRKPFIGLPDLSCANDNVTMAHSRHGFNLWMCFSGRGGTCMGRPWDGVLR